MLHTQKCNLKRGTDLTTTFTPGASTKSASPALGNAAPTTRPDVGRSDGESSTLNLSISASDCVMKPEVIAAANSPVKYIPITIHITVTMRPRYVRGVLSPNPIVVAVMIPILLGGQALRTGIFQLWASESSIYKLYRHRPFFNRAMLST